MALSVIQGYDFGIFLGLASLSAAVLWAIGAVSGVRECTAAGMFWFVPLFAIFFLRSFLIEPMRIPSASMEPGLMAGDYIAVDKSAYGYKIPGVPLLTFARRYPKRGDVVIFRRGGEMIIKRVIGLPNETVSVVGSTVIINGERVETETTNEDFDDDGDLRSRLRHVTETIDGVKFKTQLQGSPLYENFTLQIPNEHVLVLGDNRFNSQDSRAFGAINILDIWGEARWVWMQWTDYDQPPSFIGLKDIE